MMSVIDEILNRLCDLETEVYDGSEDDESEDEE